MRIIAWDAKDTGPWVEAIEGCDVVINLTGKSVNCRYTRKNKYAILHSRTESTKALGKGLQQLKNPPKVWFNMSSATIYQHSEEYPNDELTGIIGDDFSMNVCKAWEKSFYAVTLPETRKIVLRLAITLGMDGGVIPRYRNLVRFGLGGKMGSGNQMMSWVHALDVAMAIDFLIARDELHGIFNIAAPHAVTNAAFMEALRKDMHMPFGLPTPKWMLEIGAFLIGTETELILKSRWVIPQKLLAAGYHFSYNRIEKAVHT